MRRTGTLIIGAGQAGLALSRCLTDAGRDHVVIERGRIGERWHSERWDSLRLLSQNWMNRLPGEAASTYPTGFLARAEFAAHLERYARSFAAPVQEGVAVTAVTPSGGGFSVDTDAGTWLASQVVIATGECDVPHVPSISRGAPAGLAQIHAAHYRHPEALPAGAVLVVGSGASGQQIAMELHAAGREVVLAVGRHTRMVRSYRGRDIYAWLQATGNFDRRLDDFRDPSRGLDEPNLAISHDGIDLGRVHAAGVVLAGRLTGFDEAGRARFADDLADTVAASDARMFRALEHIDAHIAAHGVDAPPREPIEALVLPPGPREVDLRAHGTIVWASGYVRRYPWLHAPGVLRPDGELIHRNGITPLDGLYVLGLRWLRRRASHFIGGVGADAEFLAERIGEREDEIALPRAA